MISHGACGKQWTGLTRSHCPACHETFNSEKAANRHRKGSYGGGRHCVRPEEVGLVAVVHDWGICWKTAESDPRWGAGGDGGESEAAA